MDERCFCISFVVQFIYRGAARRSKSNARYTRLSNSLVIGFILGPVESLESQDLHDRMRFVSYKERNTELP